MTAKKPSATKAKKFWKALAAEAAELHEGVFSEGFEGLRRAHTRVGELLREHESELLYEMTNEGEKLVLLFTPEWDPERAERIDWFLTHAPAIPDWVLYNRRQRKSCEIAFDLLENALGADARDARFSVVEVEGGVHLTMHSRVWAEFEPEYHPRWVRFFLSHALGEQLLMDHVPSVALAPPSPAKLLSPEAMIKRVDKLAAG
ncbi:MAG: hypothetical protein K2V38_03460 [Gemmataceae bacterium]|nr:hypothetical protein [Gemmataceae bacterium]